MAHYADTSNYSAGELELWELLKAHENQSFQTSRGLEFTYTIKGNEFFVDRKVKSITRATVNRAYQKAVELKVVTGPKKLQIFGASYLYPVFLEIGICTKE